MHLLPLQEQAVRQIAWQGRQARIEQASHLPLQAGQGAGATLLNQAGRYRRRCAPTMVLRSCPWCAGVLSGPQVTLSTCTDSTEMQASSAQSPWRCVQPHCALLTVMFSAVTCCISHCIRHQLHQA